MNEPITMIIHPEPEGIEFIPGVPLADMKHILTRVNNAVNSLVTSETD